MSNYNAALRPAGESKSFDPNFLGSWPEMGAERAECLPIDQSGVTRGATNLLGSVSKLMSSVYRGNVYLTGCDVV
jgi:hypothetical protein